MTTTTQQPWSAFALASSPFLLMGETVAKFSNGAIELIMNLRPAVRSIGPQNYLWTRNWRGMGTQVVGYRGPWVDGPRECGADNYSRARARGNAMRGTRGSGFNTTPWWARRDLNPHILSNTGT